MELGHSLHAESFHLQHMAFVMYILALSKYPKICFLSFCLSTISNLSAICWSTYLIQNEVLNDLSLGIEQ